MYNLFVSADCEAWKGEVQTYDISRCFEYTDTGLKERFKSLSSDTINELKTYPCIFAYENGCRQDPKFGVIRDVVVRRNAVKIEYEIKTLEKFLTYIELEELSFELDMVGWELSRTHWAVKDINLAKELRSKGITLPQWTRTIGKTVDITKHTFDVALSFPGEVRDSVSQIAVALEKLIGPDAYFYDHNYVSQLARPSLDVLLQDIYAKRSKLIVVFLCGKYQEKEWCGVEFRAIKEIIKKREHQRVMFVKMDDGFVEGVFETDGYIDYRAFSPDDIARFIQQRTELLT